LRTGDKYGKIHHDTPAVVGYFNPRLAHLVRRRSDVGGMGAVPGQFGWDGGGDVDADLGHGRDGGGVDVLGWFGAGGAYFDGVAGEVV
jgi:hypothetical protein